MLNWPEHRRESAETTAARVFGWAYGIFDWTPDEEAWQQPEHWPLRSELEEHAAANGGRVKDDCDGFASLCRYALWNVGVPNRILVCTTETGGSHAVLTVEGLGLVLDNRQVRVVTRDELERIGYRWVAMSGLSPGDPWTEIKS